MSEEMNNPFKGVALIKRCLDYARHDKVVEGMVDMTRRGEGFLFFQKYSICFYAAWGSLFSPGQIIYSRDCLLAA